MITPRATQGLQRMWRTATLMVFAAVMVLSAISCGGEDVGGPATGSGSSRSSGNLVGGIGSPVTVGDAVITVKSLQSAFQPVAPAQRLSDEPLIAPAAGITFYQAIVHIENRGQMPLRIDPRDFYCRVLNTLSTLEPTRSGPAPRSIIFGTSLDLLLTFRGTAGAEPTLIYGPSWHTGIISFSAGAQSQTPATTAAPSGGQTTTTAPVIN